MELASAVALQAETLDFLYRRGSEASARALPAYTRQHADLVAQPEDIAIGVSKKTERDFQLALRVQGKGDFGPLVRTIIDRAHGEAEVWRIGMVSPYQLGPRPGGTGWQRLPSTPLLIGCSVSHIQTPWGTLGCFVRKRTDPDKAPYILSCSHVLAQLGAAKVGDEIIQPALVDCGQISPRVVANLNDSRNPDLFRVDNVVDAAIAAVETKLPIDPISLMPNEKLAGVGVINPILTLGEKVFKIGRTTDRTSGEITGVNVSNLKINLDGIYYLFAEQLEISVDRGLFAQHGDSGSLVVNNALLGLGLILGGGFSGGKSVVYANPLPKVMDSLGVDLVL
jgi:hypothetical protein